MITSRLSDRERQVLELMAEGRSNLAISERLFLGVRTVESYVSNILARLEVPMGPDAHRRVQVVLLYLREHS